MLELANELYEFLHREIKIHNRPKVITNFDTRVFFNNLQKKLDKTTLLFNNLQRPLKITNLNFIHNT